MSNGKPKTAKQVSFALDVSKGSLCGTRMLFNRFYIEKVNPHIIMHFGLVNSDNFLCDVHSFAMTREDLEQNRSRLETYLSKLDSIELQTFDGRSADWKPPLERRNTDVARFINMARTGNSAEITLCSFSLHAIIGGGSQAVINVEPSGMALLLCETAVQKSLLLELYPEPSEGTTI